MLTSSIATDADSLLNGYQAERKKGSLTGAIIWSSKKKEAVVMKFSEDVVPITDLKINPGRVIKHAADAHRPVLLTRRGRGVAVVQSVADYETGEDERAFMRAVVAGLADFEAGRELTLAEVKERLDAR